MKDKRITRKKFFKKCLIGLIGYFGCSIEFSPYMTYVNYENLNSQNLRAIKAIEAEKGELNDFKIGLFSDTHHFFSETDQIVDIMNTIMNLDFVIITGDLTNQGLLREFNWAHRIIRKLNVPSMVVIGNHDCLCFGMDIFRKMYGPLNYTFTFCDVEFIFFHNNNWEGGDPDYDWLEYVSSNSNSAKRILFSHICNLNIFEKRYSQHQEDRFNQILENYIDLAIHGHEHNESWHEIINNTPRYVIGSTEFNHYSILTYKNGLFDNEQY